MIFFHMRILKYTSLTISNVFHLPTTNSIYQEKGFLIATMFFLAPEEEWIPPQRKKISNCLFSPQKRAEQEKIIQTIFKKYNWKENGVPK